MTSQVTVDGDSTGLTHDEMAALKLLGRDLFGPMTAKEKADALVICGALFAIADAKGMVEPKAQLAKLIDGLSSGDGCQYGPTVMTRVIEEIAAEMKNTQ